MQFLYFVEFFWKLLIFTNLRVATIFELRVTYRLNMIGFEDDDVVHVEYVDNRRVVRDPEDDNV